MLRDLLHVAATCLLSLSTALLYNRDFPSSSLYDLIWSQPQQALSLCIFNVFLVSMCGNSPLAWLVAAAFTTVDQEDFDQFTATIHRHYGGLRSYLSPNLSNDRHYQCTLFLYQNRNPESRRRHTVKWSRRSNRRWSQRCSGVSP